MTRLRENRGPKNGPILVTTLSRDPILGAEKWTHIFSRPDRGCVKNPQTQGHNVHCNPHYEHTDWDLLSHLMKRYSLTR